MPVDKAKAVDYFKQAADKGDAVAEYNLGFYHSKGWGLPQSDELAFRWYLRSAEHGYGRGLCNAGHCLLHGIGTAVDLDKAADFFERGVEQGHVLSAVNLGYCFAEGKDGQKTTVRPCAFGKVSVTLIPWP